MINYETYHLVHLLCIFLFIATLSLGLWGNKDKSIKVITGVSTFLIFVTGMGLIARLGFKHTEPFPFWIWGKMVIWGILGIGGPIVIKRKPSWSRAFWLIMFLFLAIQLYFVSYKPGA
jgi:hypothetical protein